MPPYLLKSSSIENKQPFPLGKHTAILVNHLVAEQASCIRIDEKPVFRLIHGRMNTWGIPHNCIDAVCLWNFESVMAEPFVANELCLLVDLCIKFEVSI